MSAASQSAASRIANNSGDRILNAIKANQVRQERTSIPKPIDVPASTQARDNISAFSSPTVSVQLTANPSTFNPSTPQSPGSQVPNPVTRSISTGDEEIGRAHV